MTDGWVDGGRTHRDGGAARGGLCRECDGRAEARGGCDGGVHLLRLVALAVAATSDDGASYPGQQA